MSKIIVKMCVCVPMVHVDCSGVGPLLMMKPVDPSIHPYPGKKKKGGGKAL